MSIEQVEIDKLSIKAYLIDDGVRIDTNVFGRVTSEFINLRAQTQEKAVRDWLIANGWKPPVA